MIQAILFYIETLRSREDRGQGMVEYALILALVSIAAIAVLVLFGPALQGILNTVLAAL
jgi:pilus assembly protein Flp/PilA